MGNPHKPLDYDPESHPGNEENAAGVRAPDPVLRRQAILRVLALTFVLLALPVGMVVWAVRDSMRKPALEEVLELSSEDSSGLRSALEQVIDEEWGASPSLTTGEESPVFPVLEWHVTTDQWPGILEHIESQSANDRAQIVLLQEGSPPDQPARYMVAPQAWFSTLLPALAEQNIHPPDAPPMPAGTAFLFLEIHATSVPKE